MQKTVNLFCEILRYINRNAHIKKILHMTFVFFFYIFLLKWRNLVNYVIITSI